MIALRARRGGRALAILALLSQGCVEDVPSEEYDYHRISEGLVVWAPADGTWFGASLVSVRGEVDEASVRVTWTAGALAGACDLETIVQPGLWAYIQHRWSFEVTLPPGPHVIEVTATGPGRRVLVERMSIVVGAP